MVHLNFFKVLFMASQTNQTEPWSESFICRPNITTIKLILASVGNKSVASYCVEVYREKKKNKLVKFLWLILFPDNIKDKVRQIMMLFFGYGRGFIDICFDGLRRSS